MKDHVEIGHLTKYDVFRVNIDQVMDYEIWFKIRSLSKFTQTSLIINWRQWSVPHRKTMDETLKIFCPFCEL